jgi:hypothetical protein
VNQFQIFPFAKKTTLTILALAFTSSWAYAQNSQIETGLALGNVAGEAHSLGKGELHLNFLKCFGFGQLGLDFSTGGNFIPGERSTLEGNIETLSPNDSKFSAITFLYRLPISRQFFAEPRLGYASLFASVNTDDTDKTRQANFSTGIGLGAYVKRFTFSLRYQYYGRTPDYQGTRDGTIVVSNPEPVDMIFLRWSYRFGLDRLFKPESTLDHCILKY